MQVDPPECRYHYPTKRAANASAAPTCVTLRDCKGAQLTSSDVNRAGLIANAIDAYSHQWVGTYRWGLV